MDDRYIILKNGNTQMVVDRVGAQIVSLKVNGVQVMFQGATDSSLQWAGTAKNLFPNPGPVGKENEKWGALREVVMPNGKKGVQYIHNGGLYQTAQHGFAQNAEFNVQGQTADSCVMTISADQETVKEYPFDFKYDVGYEIHDSNLNYISCAKNLDNKPMLAGMGWHPAFALHDAAAKYSIVFENVEKEDDCEVEEGIEYEIAESIIEKSKSVQFRGLKSADVVLVYRDGKTRVEYLRMHTECPNIILWSRARENKGQIDFICIEPWNTTPRQIQKLTTQDKTRALADEGAVIIEPSEQSTLKADVTINPEYIKTIKQQKDNYLEM